MVEVYSQNNEYLSGTAKGGTSKIPTANGLPVWGFIDTYSELLRVSSELEVEWSSGAPIFPEMLAAKLMVL